MDVANESEFTVDEITKETIKCMKLSGKRLLFLIILVLLFVGLGIAGLIISIIQKKNIADFAMILGCFVILLLMLLYFKFMHPKSLKRNYMNEFGEVIRFKYVFHINRLDCQTISAKTRNKATFTYDSMQKIIEDNGMLRLYIAKRNFLLARISEFDSNDFEKIKKAMMNSKAKYITKKEKKNGK